MKLIDVRVITETKLDYPFLTSQFLLEGFAQPFGLDRNSNRGGVIYIFAVIFLVNLVKHVFSNDIEGL